MVRARSRARSNEDQARVRQRFIDSARTVLSRDGAASLTMRRIAAEAGYAPGSLYLYFESRRDILQCLWKDDVIALHHCLIEAAESVTEISTVRLHTLFSAYVDFWVLRPEHFMALFLEADRQYLTERATFAADESIREVHSLIVSEVELAMEAGVLVKREPTLIAHSLLASVHGVLCLHIGNEGFRWSNRSAMITTILDGLLKGLTPIAATPVSVVVE